MQSLAMTSASPRPLDEAKMAGIEALCALDAYDAEQPRLRRSVYDWSMERPGAELHVGPLTRLPPPDLDPFFEPATVPLQSPVIRTIRLDADRKPLQAVIVESVIGLTAAIAIAALALTTITAATLRLPTVVQASHDAEGV